MTVEDQTLMITNILAERYASPEMADLFDAVSRVRLERQLWIAVLEAQTELGLPLDEGVLDDYRAAVDQIDLDAIAVREAETRHDVKARLDEFNALAGHQELHKGLTSRDVTENVEQLVVFEGLALVEQRTVALLARLADLAAQYASLAIVGRTHNVPAQPTTVGKRFAQIGEELLGAHKHLEAVRTNFAIRGIKGPVGSQQDQLDLLGTVDRVAELERRVAAHLGIDDVCDNVGQVYPRSRDFSVISVLVQLGSAPANLALMTRLMAGQELATEGFRPGQVGSSAMPHKMNTRSCERINGLFTVLRGHLTMASGLAGDQWNEGDVSCSVVRRVVVPDAFFALDGLYETTFAVIRDFGVFPGVIKAELDRYLPFLATTALLVHAVRNGLGREEAHELIKEHAVTAALRLRQGEGDGRQLLQLLSDDQRFPGELAQLSALADQVTATLGTIDRQIGVFCTSVEKLTAGRSEAGYQGREIV
ncbi:MAG: adenylosuccinate lyase [Actinomycetia bacterium]|nr:adenylosuccinate lyase [Actinomycetes bacterium]MCP5032734.1 adenylosuccinate lyase [Actinomycetes bacterium]